MRGHRAIEACPVLIFALSAFGQPAPDVAEVLQKVKTTYTDISQYRLSATITEEQVAPSGKKSVAAASIKVTVQKPNHLNWEVSSSDAALITGIYVGEEVIVSDGTNVFWYLPKLRQYTRTPIGPLVTPMGTVAAFIDHIEDLLFDRFKHVETDGAKLLREEAVPVGGSPIPCYVVEMATQFQKHFTWWIDKRSNVVMREVYELKGPPGIQSLTRRTDFTVAQIGGSIDEQSFVFIPPPGARQVEARKR